MIFWPKLSMRTVKDQQILLANIFYCNIEIEIGSVVCRQAADAQVRLDRIKADIQALDL